MSGGGGQTQNNETVAEVRVIYPEPNFKPSNSDSDIKSLVYRLLAVEDRIDAENKMKALIFAEAKVNNIDIGALKATIRTIRYMPQSRADGLSGLSETVKTYLDIAIPHQKGGQ